MIDRPPASKVVTTYVTNVGQGPWITATDDFVFTVADNVTTVGRYDVSKNAYSAAGAIGGSEVTGGTSRITTNCDSLYVSRGTATGPQFFRGPVAGGNLSQLPITGLTGIVNDFAADQTYLYVALPDSGGLQLFDPQLGASPFPLWSTGVFRVAVDAEGVYWGEHPSGTNAGAIVMATK